jgi:putative transposase
MSVMAKRFLSELLKLFRKHPISTYDGILYPLYKCQFLKLKHNLHSTIEKSIIESTGYRIIMIELKV